MGDVHLHTRYLSSDRGVSKLLQIVLGFVISGLLCTNWWGGMSCFGEGRIGFASGLNFVFVVINIIIFLMNLFNLHFHRIEQVVTVIGAILFLIAFIMVMWFMIAWNNWSLYLIISEIAILAIFIMMQWDFKANRSWADSEHLPI